MYLVRSATAVATVVAAFLVPVNAHALSCVMPPDAADAMRGEVERPEWVPRGEEWTQPQMVDAFVVASGDHESTVVVLGTSFGGPGVAVPPLVTSVTWDPMWGSPLPLGRAMLEVRLDVRGRWMLPLCGIVDTRSEVPDYENRRPLSVALGMRCIRMRLGADARIGVTGFEPAISSSQTRRLTRLGHTPWLGPV